MILFVACHDLHIPLPCPAGDVLAWFRDGEAERYTYAGGWRVVAPLGTVDRATLEHLRASGAIAPVSPASAAQFRAA
jgi:hypothetical protein